MAKVIIKRDPNLKFADEASPSKFYVAKELSTGKDFILTQVDEDTWQWIDIGSRPNLSHETFDSFSEALDYALESPGFRVTEHESRIGALTTLVNNAKQSQPNTDTASQTASSYQQNGSTIIPMQ